MSKIGSELKVSCLADTSLFGTNLKETLDTLLDQLERCQRALSDFLEERRSTFPRFYFIGDDDLLEILGQGHNPEVIQVRSFGAGMQLEWCCICAWSPYLRVELPRPCACSNTSRSCTKVSTRWPSASRRPPAAPSSAS